MIKVICGMIGSGKTTYAIQNKKADDILLDWDTLVEAFKTDNPIWVKGAQDTLLEYFSTKNHNIWYITTILGSNELELLNKVKDVEYIWINTTKQQCVENIKKRNRNDEGSIINKLIKANEKIYNNYYNNKVIDYNVVEVFERGEQW